VTCMSVCVCHRSFGLKLKLKFSLRHMSSFVPQRAPQQAVDEFLTSVYTSNPRNVFSVAVTGGGSGVVADLFTVPGASNSLMHASVPYSHTALSNLLGGPEHPQSCSKETAILMAKAVFKETVSELLADSSNQFDVLSEINIFGVAGTAALVSSRPKKGLHRCHVATVSNHNVSRSWDVFFQKGLRTRREEDYACSRVILDAIASTSRLPPMRHEYLSPQSEESHVDEYNPNVEVETIVSEEDSSTESLFDDLFSAKTGMLVFVRKPFAQNDSQGVLDHFTILEDVPLPEGTFVYPGSYNPLHEGHIALAAAAVKLKTPLPSSRGTSVVAPPPLVFEISALNADKPPLTKEEIIRRVSQFAKGSVMDVALREAGLTNVAVCITSRPYFEGKAALFAGCQFIMGADTLSRLFMSKYYGDSRENMLAAVSQITGGHGCSFIVGGRKDETEESGFCDLDSVLKKVELPDCVLSKLAGLSDSQFRFDISSTEIRNREAAKKEEP
jgi:nicotinamide mononucleotide (NMN) deamidase PncC